MIIEINYTALQYDSYQAVSGKPIDGRVIRETKLGIKAHELNSFAEGVLDAEKKRTKGVIGDYILKNIVIEPQDVSLDKVVPSENVMESDEITKLYNKYTSDIFIDKMKNMSLLQVVKGAGFDSLSELLDTVEMPAYAIRKLWDKNPLAFNFLLIGSIVKKYTEAP